MSNAPESSPPSSSDLRIGIILASTRQGRRGEGYAKWIQETLGRRTGVALELLDLREHRLPAYEHPEMPPAIEQRYAKLFLESLDLLRDCRLCEQQLFSSTAEV